MHRDIFDVLQVSLREDTYSGLIVEILTRFPEISKRVFKRLTGMSPRSIPIVNFRRRLSGESTSIPDILIHAETKAGRWWILIESKVQSGEGPDQTARYFKDCLTRNHAGDCKGVTFYFLTLNGEAALMDRGQKNCHWKVITHLSLAETIKKCDANKLIVKDPVLSLPWKSYLFRLSHYARYSRPKASERVLDWLNPKPPELFVTKHERATLLGTSLLPKKMCTEAGIFPNSGGEQFYAKAWDRAWTTGYWEPGRRILDCISIHYELSCTIPIKRPFVTLSIHFESNPYMSEEEIRGTGKAAHGLRIFKESFRKRLHRYLNNSEWELRVSALQMAKIEIALSKNTTIGDLRGELRKYLVPTRKKVMEALNHARKS